MRRNLPLMGAGVTLLQGQALPPEQKQKVDDAIPVKALAKPRRPRRMLVSNLMMRDGHPWHGSSYDTIQAANYANRRRRADRLRHHRQDRCGTGHAP
jgi:hypothetical protein